MESQKSAAFCVGVILCNESAICHKAQVKVNKAKILVSRFIGRKNRIYITSARLNNAGIKEHKKP